MTTTDDDATTPATGLTREEKRLLALIVVGCATALVLGECARRIERRFARRHPLLTELVEGAAHRPRHAH